MAAAIAEKRKLLAARSKRMSAQSAKQVVRHLLDQIPEDATLEDIQYHIYVRQKIELSREDAKAGRVMSQEEVEKRMAKWLDE